MIDSGKITQKEVKESLLPRTMPEKSLPPSATHGGKKAQSSRRRKLTLLGLTLFSACILGLVAMLPFLFNFSPVQGRDPNNQNAPLVSKAIGETATTLAATPTATSTSTPIESVAGTNPGGVPTQPSVASTQIPTVAATKIPSPSGTTPVTTAVTTRYTFDNGTQGFAAINTSVRSCSDKVYAGSGSLCASLKYGSADDNPYLYIGGDPLPYSLNGKTLSAYIYVQSSTGATVSASWSLLNNNQTWVYNSNTTMAAGSWHRFSYTVPSGSNTFSRLGLDFYTSALNSDITVYVDSISW